MILGIDPKVDYAFKRLFGSVGHEPILIDVLQAVLGSQLSRPIASIEIVNPFNEKETLDDKLSILDIKARDSDGRLYNVEMQMLPGRYYCNRAVYYGSRLHSQQLREGEDYRELEATYVVSFVNSIIFREVPDYRLMFELRNREHPELLFSPQLSFCLIELPKFQLGSESVSNPLERWCYLLRHGEGLDTTKLPEPLKSPLIEKAVEVLSMMSQTELERERYESRLKAQRDYSTGMWEAREDGMLAGKREGKLEGEREATQKQIGKLLQSKFGGAGQDLLDQIKKLPEVADLDHAFDALLQAQSLAEFRAVLASLVGKMHEGQCGR